MVGEITLALHQQNCKTLLKAAFAPNVDGISDVIIAPGTQTYSNSFYIVKLTKENRKIF